jgi:hypothetical protein
MERMFFAIDSRGSAVDPKGDSLVLIYPKFDDRPATRAFDRYYVTFDWRISGFVVKEGFGSATSNGASKTLKFDN